ncbi:MAG: hypothetical protein WC315_00740 [Candidatus Omnitrophota bacterium]|jgi:hypothetical protein
MDRELVETVRDFVKNGKVFVHLITESKIVEFPASGVHSAGGYLVVEVKIPELPLDKH